MTKINDLKEKISKESIISFYITKNYTRKETALELGILTSQLDKLCKIYDIKKPKELSYKRRGESCSKNKDTMVAHIKQTKLKRYNNANYNNSEKAKETWRNKSEEEKQKDLENRKLGCLKKHGVEYTSQIPESRVKTAKTKLKRYNDPNYNNTAKSKRTKKERYNNENYVNVDAAKSTKYALYGDENYNNHEKAKLTNLAVRGVENPFQDCAVIEKIKDTKYIKHGSRNYNNINKISNTCLDRYKVSYACMRPEARSHGSNNSGPNLKFEKILQKYNMEFTREFAILNRSYDFKIDDYLIEINPWATHNSDWSPYGEHRGQDIDYHFNKSKLAWENGYKCIHVWDWDDYEEVVKNILSGKYENNSDLDKTIYLGDLSAIKPTKYIWNKKLKKLVNEFTSDCVIIYGVGQI